MHIFAGYSALLPFPIGTLANFGFALVLRGGAGLNFNISEVRFEIPAIT